MTSLPERRLHDDVSPPSSSSQKRTKSDGPDDGVDHESLDAEIAPAWKLLRDDPFILLAIVAKAYLPCDSKYNLDDIRELSKLRKTDEMKERLQDAIET